MKREIKLKKMIMSIWDSENNIPYITFCEQTKEKTPIFSMEFKTKLDRDIFINKRLNELNK